MQSELLTAATNFSSRPAEVCSSRMRIMGKPKQRILDGLDSQIAPMLAEKAKGLVAPAAAQAALPKWAELLPVNFTSQRNVV